MECLESRACSSDIISKRVGLGVDRDGLGEGVVKDGGGETDVALAAAGVGRQREKGRWWAEGGEGVGERKGSERKPCFIIADTSWFLEALVGALVVVVVAVVLWDGMIE